MARIRIKEKGEKADESEDSFHDSPLDPAIEATHAHEEAHRSIVTLLACVHQGDGSALDYLYQIAEQLSEILNDQGNAWRFEDQARKNWESLVKSKTAWPIMLPAETDRQAQALSIINTLPLGESCGIKLYKVHQGDRKPPGRSFTSPARVAKNIQWSMEQIRSRIQSYRKETVTDDEFARFFQGVPISLIQQFRNLPAFSKASLADWKSAATTFIDISKKRTLFIPEQWKADAAKSGCGYPAYVRKTVKAGLDTICPPTPT